jgi:hypothetical protein
VLHAGQSLGEYIRDHLLGWILGESNACLVVSNDDHRVAYLNTEILEEIDHPYRFLRCLTKGHVLGLRR